jgi:uncharacterized protein
MVDPEVRDSIRNLIAALGARGLHVVRVVIYGSYVSQKAHADSDLDVAIISPDFGKGRFEEGKMLLQVAWRIDPRLHPIPVSLSAYENELWMPLIHEIRTHGIEFDEAI